MVRWRARARIGLFLAACLLVRQSWAAPPVDPADSADSADPVAALMAAGRSDEAVLAAERAVMFEPANAGAWLDLAILYQRRGDLESAAALYDRIEAEFDPPAGIRAIIARQRAALQAWLPRGLRWSVEIALLAGHETNINLAPVVSQLSLTLPEGTFQLPLDPRYRARAADGGVVEARAEAALPWAGQGQLLGYGEVRHRIAARAEDDLTSYQAQLGLRRELSSRWSLVGWLGQQGLDSAGRTLYATPRLQLALERAAGQCALQTGAEAEWRDYPAQPALNGSYAGLFGGALCGRDVGLANGQGGVNLRLGRDRAAGARAGGDQWQASLTAAWSHPWARGRLEFVLGLGLVRDDEAYSPLLDNAVRDIVRTSLRAEYAAPLAPHWQWLLRAEVQRQQSNLELFRVRDETLFLGLRRGFGA